MPSFFAVVGVLDQMARLAMDGTNRHAGALPHSYILSELVPARMAGDGGSPGRARVMSVMPRAASRFIIRKYRVHCPE